MSDTGLLCWFYVYKDDKICGIFIIKKVEETPMFFYSKTSLTNNGVETYENDDLIKKIIATTFKKTNSTTEENNIFTFNQANKSMVCADYTFLEWYLKNYFNMNTIANP